MPRILLYVVLYHSGGGYALGPRGPIGALKISPWYLQNIALVSDKRVPFPKFSVFQRIKTQYCSSTHCFCSAFFVNSAFDSRQFRSNPLFHAPNCPIKTMATFVCFLLFTRCVDCHIFNSRTDTHTHPGADNMNNIPNWFGCEHWLDLLVSVLFLGVLFALVCI